MSDEPTPAEEPGTEETPESEETPGSEEPAAEDDEKGKEEAFDEGRAKSALAKKNRENANLRKRLKDAEEKANKYDKLEDAQKSESEKLNEKASSAEKRASAAEQEAARLRVALKKGLSVTQAKRLVGETEDELEEDADELLADFVPKKDEGEDGDKKDEKDEEAPEADSKRRPKERLRPGAAPSADPEPDDPKSLASRVSHDW